MAHYPSRTRFPHTENFCMQALWQGLSMPGKLRPLEALNSIVSRSQGPSPKQELHEWSQSSPHSHRWRVPGASRYRLASVKRSTSWPENMGERLCLCTAPLLSQEAALHVPRVQVGPPGEVVENTRLLQQVLPEAWQHQHLQLPAPGPIRQSSTSCCKCPSLP